MRAMTLSRSSRSVVALITAVLLLLCQAALAAQACGHMFVPQSPAAPVPCHESMDGAGSMQHTPAAVSDCDAPKAIAAAVKIPVFSVTDFPPLPLLLAYQDAEPVVRLSFTPHAVPALCHSPPLNLLHCRFLN
jgi:hypothetical protein